MTTGELPVSSARRRSGVGRRLVVVASCVVFSVVAACTLFNPLDEYGPPKPHAEAGGDVVTAVDAKASCARERWPNPPSKDDATGDLELVLALRSFGFTPPPDAGQVATGFDLDGLCTCPDAPSCEPPPDAGVPCDGDGGVDDKGAQLMTSFAALARLASDRSDQVEKGVGGLLIRIGHYNGGLDDTQVELSVFRSLGIQDDAGKPKPPLHDGNDEWTLDSTFLFGGGGPPFVPNYVDSNAYVSGGWLVSRAEFPLDVGTTSLPLRGGAVVARLVHDGARYTLEDGRFVGRIASADLLTGLDTIEDPFASVGGLCGDSGLYASLKSRICGAVDLTSAPGDDNKGAPCDALGMTVLFAAEPAKFGSILAPKPRDHLCGADWKDDCSR